jgi:uracil-DNA glycosylase
MIEEQFSLFDLGETAPPPAAASAPPTPDHPATAANMTAASGIGPYSDMDTMRQDCDQCDRCELGATRTHAVVSRGNPNAKIMIIGEGPGENEDLTGKPFVGKAGQLLDRVLESVKLTEDDVFICNIVKCRPPGNRKPTKAEMNACRPYLMEQIRLVNPPIIMLAGASAIEGLFNEKAIKITQIRGTWREWEGRQCLPVFHPSYLLRNPSKEKGSPKWLMWQDIQEVKRKLDEINLEEAF